MKKIIIIVLVLTLSQCQIKIEPKTANAQSYQTYNIANDIPYGYNGNGMLNVTVYNKDGMEYRIFTHNGYNGKSLYVINHTKELLEVEKLKLEIAKLKNGN